MDFSHHDQPILPKRFHQEGMWFTAMALQELHVGSQIRIRIRDRRSVPVLPRVPQVDLVFPSAFAAECVPRLLDCRREPIVAGVEPAVFHIEQKPLVVAHSVAAFHLRDDQCLAVSVDNDFQNAGIEIAVRTPRGYRLPLRSPDLTNRDRRPLVSACPGGHEFPHDRGVCRLRRGQVSYRWKVRDLLFHRVRTSLGRFL